MSTITERLEYERANLGKIDNYLEQLQSKLTKEYLTDALSKQDRFYQSKSPTADQDAQNKSKSKSYKDLSLNQLNQRNEEVEQQLRDLRTLQQIQLNLNEIESTIDNLNISMSSLLDLQHLNTLFKSIKDKLTLDYVICKQVAKKVSSLHQTFMARLNDYLRLVMPNECTIQNLAILHDFNYFVIKNGYVLDTMGRYRDSWDLIVDRIFNANNKSDEIKIELLERKAGEEDVDEDSVEIKIVQAFDSNKSFLSSLSNFIKFINAVNVPSIKQFLESKISKLIIDKLSRNIDSIINDPAQIDQLKQLVKLCEEKSQSWNILSKLEGSGKTIEDKLHYLHQDWLVDEYVNKVKVAIISSGVVQSVAKINIKRSSKDTVKETVNVAHMKEIAQHKQESLEQTAQAVVEDDIDDDAGWDENWDDGWDVADDNDNEEDNDGVNAHMVSKNVDSSHRDASKDKDKETRNHANRENEEEKEKEEEEEEEKEDDKKEGIEKVSISSIPEIVKPIFNEFLGIAPKEINYLVTTIKALATVLYPNPKTSFLLYNDFTLLSQELSHDSFAQFAEHTWNQVTMEVYSELKQLINSLDFSLDVELEDESVLDDYNLNQISLLYKWFQTLFEETELQATNPRKFKFFVADSIDFINNIIMSKIISMEDIGETQCTVISLTVESLNNVTVPYLTSLGIPQKTIESYNKLDNVKFLLNNHLKDIMERFYQGELFDLNTEEIIGLLRSVFLPSELRDGYIDEVKEFRNMS
ncbi:protein transport protein dsl1 [Lodderomyces elongisporus]|uniref:protein transport protein dsl1 n=1 Tax=Lodderomyces elongisporus TaxID=36914 RepID=UPI002925F508|nr:protein transport protein dsl1 [Lodderomyces elongisporus]WLF78900.1 protein transport protein dsl1 [Lodderomyces elongisporus]